MLRLAMVLALLATTCAADPGKQPNFPLEDVAAVDVEGATVPLGDPAGPPELGSSAVADAGIEEAVDDPVTAAQSTPSSLLITTEVSQTGTHYANWVPGNTTTPTGSLTSSAPPDPGDDYNGTNEWVRTLDVTTVTVTYSVSPATVSGPTEIVVDINGGPVFLQSNYQLAVGVSGDCPGGTPPGDPNGFVINATRTGFTCQTGVFTGLSGTRSFDVLIVAPMSTPHGSTFTVTATLSESGDAPNEVSDTSTPVKVSAGPRFELVKRLLSVGIGTENGPAGSSGPGLVQHWAIGIAVLSTEPYGLSALPDPIILSDLVGATPAAGVWLLRCTDTANQNDALYAPWPAQESSFPGPNDLLAPIPTCSQVPAPNGPISVSLAGIDWDRLITPPPPGLLGYFALDTWVDADEVTNAPGGKVTVCNSIETTIAGQGTGTGTWHPLDVSENPNLLGESEPIANNGDCTDVEVPPPLPGGNFAKSRVRPNAEGDTVARTDTTQSAIQFFNTGNVPYPAGAVLCDKWDDSRFSLDAFVVVSTSSGSNPRVSVEYGTGDWGGSSLDPDPEEWWRQATSFCNNADFLAGPFPTTAAVLSDLPTLPAPPPAAGFNMVRITILDPLPLSEIVRVDVTWRMLPSVVPGDELRNYAAAFFPHFMTWLTSTCPGTSQPDECRPGLMRGESAGRWSQWWTISAGSLVVVKSRPDTAAYAPGGTVTWAISARGVGPTSGATGFTSDVTIVDVLPPGLTYVPGSTVGLPEPTCTTTDPQVCTWTVGQLPWTAAPTVNFTFQTMISAFQASGTYTNTARGHTPDDPTPHGLPSADRRVSVEDVEVLRASGAAIDKSVAPAAPMAGDTIIFRLRYGNPSTSDVQAMDAIDILPFDADPRGSQFGAGSLTLTGIAISARGAPEEIWVTDVDPAGLDAIDGVDGYLDPNAAGVASVPSAQWPCLVAPGSGVLTDATGGACPFSFAQVTALRIVGTGTLSQPFLPTGSGPYAITVTYSLAACLTGDRFANSWLAQFSNLLPVRFPAQTAAPAGCPPEGQNGGPDDGVLTPTPSLLAPVPVGPAVPAPSTRLIALTGAAMASMALLALMALAVGLMLLAASRRRERSAAFTLWVRNASLDELLRFARGPAPPVGRPASRRHVAR
ncbi:MAG: DUF11 domain-containing protein [Acidimicrobiales bacterium]